MPVTDHDVSRDQVNSRRGPILAALPLTHSGHAAIQEAVAPHPHLAVRLGEVVVEGANFLGEHFRAVARPAARAVRIREDEDLVHAHVDGVRLAHVGQLIHEIEHHLVDVRMKRAVAPAINSLVVRVLPRRLIELGMGAKQSEGLRGPGLMSQ
ncbi:MAG TPA: hypothetical protein VG860_15050 [Terriglobia bacterium]|nr:hypothetical protein [Terriglobia bacterium]